MECKVGELTTSLSFTTESSLVWARLNDVGMGEEGHYFGCFLKCPCRCSSEKRLSKWATVIRRNMFLMWEWTFMLSCYKKCTSDYKVRTWGFHQSLTWKHKAHKTNPLHDALSSCIALETSCVQHPTCCDEATEVTDARKEQRSHGWTYLNWNGVTHKAQSLCNVLYLPGLR